MQVPAMDIGRKEHGTIVSILLKSIPNRDADLEKCDALKARPTDTCAYNILDRFRIHATAWSLMSCAGGKIQQSKNIRDQRVKKNSTVAKH
jgi:hypothetical protein